jgi:glycosyltransferase involved in cell wall biosynthesis
MATKRSGPLVSVVIATHNYGRYLAEAIESVRSQTYAHWELWIIDDGSTDGTRDLVQRWQADQRIQYVYCERMGQARAKNLGISLSRGEWVAFLDADDRWEQVKLSRQLEVAEHWPEAGVIYCRRRLMNAQGQELQHPTSRQAELPDGWVIERLVIQNFICFSSAMVRRQVFSHVGMFDTNLELAIDYDLWLRVAMHYQFAAVDEPLVWYRMGHGNLSQRVVERGQLALMILDRAIECYGLADRVSLRSLYEARASTCRTLGYIWRSRSCWEAARWYWRSWRAGGKWHWACRGWLGCFWAAWKRGVLRLSIR